MAQKWNLIKSKKLTDSAKGEDCTLEIPGHCNGNPETTVGCHVPVEGGIMGGKTDDTALVFGCSGCHAAIDQHLISEEEALFYKLRGLARTIKRQVLKGVLKVA